MRESSSSWIPSRLRRLIIVTRILVCASLRVNAIGQTCMLAQYQNQPEEHVLGTYILFWPVYWLEL